MALEERIEGSDGDNPELDTASRDWISDRLELVVG